MVLMPFCLASMPKATHVPRYACLAKDEYTGLRYRITPSPETRKKFAKVGRPNRCIECFPHACRCYNYPKPVN